MSAGVIQYEKCFLNSTLNENSIGQYVYKAVSNPRNIINTERNLNNCMKMIEGVAAAKECGHKIRLARLWGLFVEL